MVELKVRFLFMWLVICTFEFFPQLDVLALLGKWKLFFSFFSNFAVTRDWTVCLSCYGLLDGNA